MGFLKYILGVLFMLKKIGFQEFFQDNLFLLICLNNSCVFILKFEIFVMLVLNGFKEELLK